MKCFNFSGDDRKWVAAARQRADAIFLHVVEPAIRGAATDGANWIGTGATWNTDKQTPPGWASNRLESDAFRLDYRSLGPNRHMDRKFRMTGEIRVENEGHDVTIAVDCQAYGGRIRDAQKRELVDIPAVKVCVTRSWPVAEEDEASIGQWVREQVAEFIRHCRKAQPHQGRR